MVSIKQVHYIRYDNVPAMLKNSIGIPGALFNFIRNKAFFTFSTLKGP
jgi:hypothetical protein